MTLYPHTILLPGSTTYPGPDDLSGYATSVGKLTGEAVVTGQGAGAQDGQPIIYVSVAFDSDLTKTPNWIDVTPWVRAVSIRRGRQMELDEFQTGTCSVLLDGNDGRFNPQRADGPYVGYLTPLRRVRVFVAYKGAIYYLFQGFAEAWQPNYRNGGEDETVTLTAADAFKLLGAKAFTQRTFSAKRPTDRVAEVLQGLPGIEYRSLGNGTVWCASNVVDGAESALALAKEGAKADLGLLYCDERGRVTFEPRTYRSINETTDRYVFGEEEADDEIPYLAAEFSYNDDQVYTEVKVTPSASFSAQQTATASSTTEFGERTLSLALNIQQGSGSSAPDTNPDTATASSFATALLNRYKYPGIRLNEITVNPFASADTLLAALNLQISNRVRVLRRPAWSSLAAETSPEKLTGLNVLTTDGNLINMPVFVERIEHAITPGRWTVKYGMSPADSLAYFDVAQEVLPSTSAASDGATSAVVTGTSGGEPTVRYGTTSSSRTLAI